MLYASVWKHAALQGRAAADTRDAALKPHFEAQQALAECLLGLTAPARTDPDEVSLLLLAITLQVNYQYEQGVSAFVYSSLFNNPNTENRSFREALPLVHPHAEALVTQVVAPEGVSLAESYRTVTSARGPQQ